MSAHALIEDDEEERDWNPRDFRKASSVGYLVRWEEVGDQFCAAHEDAISTHPQSIIGRWKVVAGASQISPSELEFQALAQQWRQETGKLSMLHKIVLHPAYQRIIGMGDKALPLIFKELKQRGGHWIWALAAITRRDDVALPQHNFRQAVEAWLTWGEQNGYL